MDTEVFKIIGITTGPQIVFFIILGFWGKKITEKFITESIELKKADIQKNIIEFSNSLEIKHFEIRSNIEKELQKHQNHLENWKFKFEKKYEATHNKTMDVIEDTYTNLYTFGNLIKPLIINIPSSNSSELLGIYEQARNKLEEINTSFFKRKIYLPKLITDKIKIVIDNFYTIINNGSFVYTIQNPQNKTKAQKDEEFKNNEIITKYLNEDLPLILTNLEKEFRKLMN